MKKALVFIFICVIGWKLFVYRHHVNLIPAPLGAWWIQYSAEKSFGFGPSGNEAGIIVFAMPEKTREEIENNGISWLKSLPCAGRKRCFPNWEPTPVSTEVTWADKDRCSEFRADIHLILFKNGCPSVSGFLGHGGSSLDLDEEIEREINAAIFSKGAFYSISRSRLLLIIPEDNRIVFAYNG
ncbi:MAG: hypothetical protein ABJK39_08425 [Hyphomicrobiales bacterium]